jgi:predicted dehydrogenase
MGGKMADRMKVDRPTRIAVVGCGYCSDFYGHTLNAYPQLELIGAYDLVAERTESFCTHYGGRPYATVEELLTDIHVDIVVNLTSVQAHHAVTRAALLAGKHVYSEKPFATSLSDGEELVALAEQRGLSLSGAPATVYGRSFKTLREAVTDGLIGTVRAVYAEMDGNALPLQPYKHWASLRGLPWPYREEVSVGCVLEHSPYQLSWLTTLFGPVLSMAHSAESIFADSWREEIAQIPPDLSVGLLRFKSGVVCRLTCSWVAPSNMSLLLIGDNGTLSVSDVWQQSTPVSHRRRLVVADDSDNYLSDAVELPLVGLRSGTPYPDTHDIDWAAGVADLADAVRSGRKPTITAHQMLHMLNIGLRLARESPFIDVGTAGNVADWDSVAAP